MFNRTFTSRSTTSQLRLRARAVLGGAAVVAAVAGTAWAPSALAATTVQILSQSSYVDSIDYRHLVGEVQNTGTTNVNYTRISFNLYDASGRLLATDFTYTSADILAPGERSPFETALKEPAGYDHYTATVTTSATSTAPNHNFTATVTNEYTDSIDYRHIVGTIRNNNTTASKYVEAIFTFYDGSGTAVKSDYTFVNTDSSSTLAGGQEASFEETTGPSPAFSTYRILVESSTPPSASSTPTQSPTPSSSPASPSPAPSSSSTDSPSPEPTSSPEVTPSLSVSPSVINAGQRVTVTYSGAPNTRLDIYSKTQPATSYSRITSVVLDANGYGTTSHAPHKNTRIMAKTAGGLTSVQPLIQVRSVASLNVRRVATRQFNFAGTVSPALSNRLVNLYRNGTLVAQGRTNASGVYSITKALAAGTYNFQARTPNDTYNLGANSPTRIVKIY